MNVVIVGIDDEFCEELSQTVAVNIACEYVNFNDLFSVDLIRSFDFPLAEANENLNQQEKLRIQTLAKRDNVVTSINHSAFLSNENYALFEQALTICVEKKQTEKILKNIQNLIKKHCKICLNQEKINLKEIKYKIKSYYNEK